MAKPTATTLRLAARLPKQFPNSVRAYSIAPNLSPVEPAPAKPKRRTIFSGIQPTGVPHVSCNNLSTTYLEPCVSLPPHR